MTYCKKFINGINAINFSGASSEIMKHQLILFAYQDLKSQVEMIRKKLDDLPESIPDNLPAQEQLVLYKSQQNELIVQLNTRMNLLKEHLNEGELEHELTIDNQDEFITNFASYFRNIKHLADTLSDAPPSIKQYQTLLYLKLLSELKIEEQEEQIQSLSEDNLKDLIEQSLQLYETTTDPSLRQNCRQLTQMAVFELISRASQNLERDSNKNNYTQYNEVMKTLLSKLVDVGKSSILDNLNQYQNTSGTSVLDLLNSIAERLNIDLEAKNSETIPALITRKQLLTHLHFGQEDRRAYVSKVKSNLVRDLFWARNIRDIELFTKSKTSDEAYAGMVEKHFFKKAKPFDYRVSTAYSTRPKTQEQSVLYNKIEEVIQSVKENRGTKFNIGSKGENTKILGSSTEQVAIDAVKAALMDKFSTPTWALDGGQLVIYVYHYELKDEDIKKILHAVELRNGFGSNKDTLTSQIVLDHELTSKMSAVKYTGNSLEDIEQKIKTTTTTTTTDAEQQKSALDSLQKIRTEMKSKKFDTNIAALNLENKDELILRKLLELKSLYQYPEIKERIQSPVLDEAINKINTSEKSFAEQVSKFKEALMIERLEEEINKAYNNLSKLDTKLVPSKLVPMVVPIIEKAKVIQSSAEQRITKANALESIFNSPLSLEEKINEVAQIFKLEYQTMQPTLGLEPSEMENVYGQIDEMAKELVTLSERTKTGDLAISNDEERAYFSVIEQIARQLDGQDLNNVRFKLKHSAHGKQVVHLFDEQNKLIKSLTVTIPTKLPYSLIKPIGEDFIFSYGGSRGIISPFEGLDEAYKSKRFASHSRLLGVGQYGSVKEVESILTGLNYIVKKGYAPGEKESTFTEASRNDTKTRPITAKDDPLYRVEINVLQNLAKAEATLNKTSAGNTYYWMEEKDKENEEVRKSGNEVFEKAKARIIQSEGKPKEYHILTTLAQGETFADTANKVLNLSSKGGINYHNPNERVSRSNTTYEQELSEMLSLSQAIAKKAQEFSSLGFSHNDIKPENFLYKRNAGGTYKVSFIDWATGGFEKNYEGKAKDMDAIWAEVFGSDLPVSKRTPNKIEDSKGRFIKLAKDGSIVFGIKPTLEILHGARNGTLPYISPKVLGVDRKNKTIEGKGDASLDTVLEEPDDSYMDDWALTAMTLGICNRQAYFQLVKGRIVNDYVIPGILEHDGGHPAGLKIVDLNKFNQFFACGSKVRERELTSGAVYDDPNGVMFIPSNQREGEPLHLYRRLDKLRKELEPEVEKKGSNSEEYKIVHELDELLSDARRVVASGEGYRNTSLALSTLTVQEFSQLKEVLGKEAGLLKNATPEDYKTIQFNPKELRRLSGILTPLNTDLSAKLVSETQLQRQFKKAEDCLKRYEKLHDYQHQEAMKRSEVFEAVLKDKERLKTPQDLLINAIPDSNLKRLEVLCTYPVTENEVNQTLTILDQESLLSEQNINDYLLNESAPCPTLLKECVSLHQNKILDHLLEKITSPNDNFIDRVEQQGLLHYAAQEGMTDVFTNITKALKKAGASNEKIFKLMMTQYGPEKHQLHSAPYIKWATNCLHIAIRNNNAKQLQTILDSLVQGSDQEQHLFSALHLAATLSNKALFKQIKEHYDKLNPDKVLDARKILTINLPPNDSSPYHLLIGKKTENGYDPIDWDDLARNKELGQSFLLTAPKGTDAYPLLNAAREGNTIALHALMKLGNDVGLTPEQWSLFWQQKDESGKNTLNHLLEQGLFSTYQECLLHIQTHCANHQETILYLLSNPHPVNPLKNFLASEKNEIIQFQVMKDTLNMLCEDFHKTEVEYQRARIVALLTNREWLIGKAENSNSHEALRDLLTNDALSIPLKKILFEQLLKDIPTESTSYTFFKSLLAEVTQSMSFEDEKVEALQLPEVMKEVSRQNGDLARLIEAIIASQSNYKEELASYQKHLEKTVHDLSVQQDAIDELNDSLSSSQLALKEAQENEELLREELEKLNEDLRTNIKELEQTKHDKIQSEIELELIKETHNKQLALLDEKLAVSSTAIKSLSDDIQAKEGELISKREALHAAQRELLDLRAENYRLQTQLEFISSIKDAEKERLSKILESEQHLTRELTSKVDKLESGLNRLTEERDMLSAQVVQLQADNHNHLNQINSLSKDVTHHKQESERITALLKEEQERTARLNESLNQTRDELDIAQLIEQKLQTQIATQAQTYSQKIASLEEELNTANFEKTLVQEELKASNANADQIQELEKKLKASEIKASLAEGELEEFKEQHNSRSQDFEQELKNNRGTIQDLQDRLEVKEKELQGELRANEEARAALLTLQNEHLLLNAALSESKELRTADKNALEKILETTKVEHQKNLEKVSDVSRQLAEAQTQNEHLTQKTEDLRAANEDLDEQVKTLGSEVQYYTDRLNSVSRSLELELEKGALFINDLAITSKRLEQAEQVNDALRKEIEIEKETYARNLAKLKAKDMDSQQEIADLEAKDKVSQQELAKLKAEQDRLKEEQNKLKDEHNGKLKGLEAQLDQGRNEISELKIQIDAQKAQLLEKEEAVKQAKVELQDLQAVNRSLSRDLESSKDTSAKEKSELETILAEERKRSEELGTQANQASTTLAIVRGDLFKSEQEVLFLRAVNARLGEQVSTVSSQVAFYQNHVSAVVKQLQTEQTKAQESQNQLAATQSKLAQAQQVSALLQTQISEQNKAHEQKLKDLENASEEELNEAKKTHTQALSNLESQLASALGSLDGLSDRLKTQEAELETRQQARDKAQVELAALKNEHLLLQQTLSQSEEVSVSEKAKLSEALAQQEQRSTELTDKVAVLTKTLKTAQEQQVRLALEADDLKAANHALEQEVKTLASDVQHYKKEFESVSVRLDLELNKTIGLERTLATTTEKLNQLQLESESLREEIANEKATHDKKVKELELKGEESTQELDKLKEEHTRKLEGLEVQLALEKREVSSLETQVEAQRAALSDKEAVIKQIQGQLLDLQGVHQRLINELANNKDVSTEEKRDLEKALIEEKKHSEELRTKVNQASGAVERMNETLFKSEQDVLLLRAENAILSEQVSTFSSQITSYQNHLTEVLKQLQTEQTKAQESQNQLAATQSKLAQAQQVSALLQTQISEQNKAHEQKLKDLENASEEELNEAKKTHTQALSNLESQLASALGSLDGLSDRLKTQETELETRQQARDKAQVELAALKNEHLLLQQTLSQSEEVSVSEKAKLSEALAQQEQRSTELTDKVAVLTNTLETAQKHQTRLTQEANDLRATNQDLEQNVKTLTSQVQQYKKELETVSARLDLEIKKSTGLEQNLATTTKEFNQLQVDSDALREEIANEKATHAKKVNELEAKGKESTKELDNLKREHTSKLVVLEAQLAQGTHKISALETQIEAQKGQLSEKEEAIQQVQGQLLDLQGVHQRLVSELASSQKTSAEEKLNLEKTLAVEQKRSEELNTNASQASDTLKMVKGELFKSKQEVLLLKSENARLGEQVTTFSSQIALYQNHVSAVVKQLQTEQIKAQESQNLLAATQSKLAQAQKASAFLQTQITKQNEAHEQKLKDLGNASEKDLNEAKKAHTQALVDLRVQLNSADYKIRELDTLLETQKTELQKQQAAKEQAQAELVDLKNENLRLSFELKQSKQTSKEEQERLKKDLETGAQRVGELEGTVEELHTQLIKGQALQAELTSEAVRLKSANADLVKEVETLKDRVNTLEAELNATAKKLEAEEEKSTSLSADLAKTASKLTTAQDLVASLKNEINLEQAKYEDLRNKGDEASATHNQALADLRGQLERVTVQAQTFEQQLKGQNEAFTAKEKALSEVRETLDELQKTHELLSQEYQKLQDTNDVSAQEKIALLDDLARAKATGETLKDQATKDATALQKMSEVRDKFEIETRRLVAENATLATQVTILSTQVDLYKNKLDEVETQMLGLSLAAAQTEEELARTKIQLERSELVSTLLEKEIAARTKVYEEVITRLEASDQASKEALEREKDAHSHELSKLDVQLNSALKSVIDLHSTLDAQSIDLKEQQSLTETAQNELQTLNSQYSRLRQEFNESKELSETEKEELIKNLDNQKADNDRLYEEVDKISKNLLAAEQQNKIFAEQAENLERENKTLSAHASNLEQKIAEKDLELAREKEKTKEKDLQYQRLIDKLIIKVLFYKVMEQTSEKINESTDSIFLKKVSEVNNKEELESLNILNNLENKEILKDIDWDSIVSAVKGSAIKRIKMLEIDSLTATAKEPLPVLAAEKIEPLPKVSADAATNTQDEPPDSLSTASFSEHKIPVIEKAVTETDIDVIPSAQPTETQSEPVLPAQPTETQSEPAPPAQPRETQSEPVPPARPMETQMEPVPPAQPTETQSEPVPAQPMETQSEPVPSGLPTEPADGQKTTHAHVGTSTENESSSDSSQNKTDAETSTDNAPPIDMESKVPEDVPAPSSVKEEEKAIRKYANMLMEQEGLLAFNESKVKIAKLTEGMPQTNGAVDTHDIHTTLTASSQSLHHDFQYKGVHVAPDEAIRAHKVYTAPIAGSPDQKEVTGVALLQQVNTGSVHNMSYGLFTENQKTEIALKQAQMLLTNYKPKAGINEIIIRGVDPVMAKKVYAACLVLQAQHPHLKELKIKSFVAGFSGPEYSRFKLDSTVRKAFIKQHLPLVGPANTLAQQIKETTDLRFNHFKEQNKMLKENAKTVDDRKLKEGDELHGTGKITRSK